MGSQAPTLPLRTRAAVYAAAMTAVVIAGATPVATKIAVNDLDAVLVGLLRTVLAASIALPLVMALRVPLPATRRHGGLLTISGSCAFVGFPVIFGIGQSLTSASHAALIYAANPLLIGVFAALIERRRPGRPWWAGCAVAFAGEVFLIGFRGEAAASGASLAGDALVALAVMVLCLGYVVGARLTQEGYSTWGTTFWGLVAGGMVLAPFVPVVGAGTGWRDASLAAWSGVAFLTLGASLLAYVCLYWSFAKGGIARTGTLYFLAPVVTLGLAVTVLGETLSLPLIAAAAVILGGVYLARRR